MSYHEDTEATHSIPPELEKKLVEAKKWYDRRAELEETIARGGGIAERNQEDRDAIDREGGLLLAEIVDAIEKAWGFAG